MGVIVFQPWNTGK